MGPGSVPRIVVVTRATEYEILVARHGTREQAKFFLSTRGRAIEEVEVADARVRSAIATVAAAVPADWRRSRIDRADLDRFLFEPSDVVVAIGQDGLVANVAKYLAGQSVVGVNPDPGRNEGVLVHFAPDAGADAMVRAAGGSASVRVEERTMVQASLDDGLRLVALNEIFVGHQSHQSARYVVSVGARTPANINGEARGERQSSSGIVVSTGTGATGWGRSISLERHSAIRLPKPEERALAFFVREAWPSVATGTSVTEGRLEQSASLRVASEMNEGGVVFGDGIEADHLEFNWGRMLEVRVAEERLRLVVA